ncbi:MAG: hypothetical protein KJ621_21080 [Proteobacteria bacterium]|nr:hypothetical protein [Pseudomonadota bacterium]
MTEKIITKKAKSLIKEVKTEECIEKPIDIKKTPQNTPEENEFFSTHNIALAAYLKLSGQKLFRTDKKKENKEFFFFQKTSETRKIIDAFYEGTARVSPSVFWAEIGFIRSFSRDTKKF